MIDYALLAKSVEFYEAKGFTRIESPWTVSESVCNLTKPQEKSNYKIEHTKKCLVGSGEQSFLYLYTKGFLPKGKFQTITPCFRDDLFTLIHTKYFMKNELIITDKVDEAMLKLIVYTAFEFFTHIGLTPVITPQPDGTFDICEKGIELGSYGIRKLPFLTYIYGTGLAEPRTSYVINM